MLNDLNEQQKKAVLEDGNVLIIACPGSGKTRVITYKIAYELDRMQGCKKRVAALTYTNRAADEICNRITSMDIGTDKLWIGTIHSFSLDWILRPYAGYCCRIKNGFTIIDDHFRDELLDELKDKHGVKPLDDIITRLNRYGEVSNNSTSKDRAAAEYHNYLRENKLIDFDLVLFLAYRLLLDFPLICRAISSIFALICVDEYQDTQDLQYGILGEIVRAGEGQTRIVFVGDPGQAIYGSLGGVARTKAEIESEIGDLALVPLDMSGNYRSCQRIIDYYSNFQVKPLEINAVGPCACDSGLITLNNVIERQHLHTEIASLIENSLKMGIPDHEICVIAPQWYLIIPMGKKLMKLLPGVKFDAPGLTPLQKNGKNLWYKLARLFLTEPSPSMFLLRLRWASSCLQDIATTTGTNIANDVTNADLLKIINSIKPLEPEGIRYLEVCFSELMQRLDIYYLDFETLVQQWKSFFEGARKKQLDPDIPTDVNDFKRMFKEAKGVTISTCHGVKGQEFATVIAFGLLRGYLPHWSDIFAGPLVEEDSSKKLLYVICSRAKKHLHLIAEAGRVTRRGNPYSINPELNSLRFGYDKSVGP